MMASNFAIPNQLFILILAVILVIVIVLVVVQWRKVAESKNTINLAKIKFYFFQRSSQYFHSRQATLCILCLGTQHRFYLVYTKPPRNQGINVRHYIVP